MIWSFDVFWSSLFLYGFLYSLDILPKDGPLAFTTASLIHGLSPRLLPVSYIHFIKAMSMCGPSQSLYPSLLYSHNAPSRQKCFPKQHSTGQII